MSESKGKSLFILKSESGRLDSVEQFLKNRGWTVVSHTQPRESIEYVLKSVPDYILLCVDHPNAKVRSLPRMLSQAVPSIIIPFAEDSTGNSFEAIRKLEAKYSVYPPVSGPSVERVLLRIKRDEENRLKKEALQKERALSGHSADDDDDTIRLKASGSKVDQAYAKSTDAQNKSDASYAAGQKYENDSNYSASQSASTDSTQATSRDQKSGAELLGPPSHKDTPKPQIEKGAGMGKALQSAQKPSESKRGALFPDQVDRDDPLDSHPSEGKKKKPPILDSSQKKNNKNSSASHPSSEEPASANGSSGTKKASPNSAASADNKPASSVVNRRQKQVPIFEEEKAKVSNLKLVKETLISEGAEAVLMETTETLDSKEFEEIQKVVNLVCITIDSARYSGYLLAALGKDKVIDKAFIEIMRRRLFHFLRNRGEPIENEESMDIKVKPMDFKDFAMEEADFLKRSAHKGEELAVAFFPYQKAAEKPQDSHIENMVLINLDDITEDAPLEFDAYIHLEKNDRMICYTGKGRFLLNHQKEKLKKRGYSSLHVKKDEVQDIKRFKAQNYFNEKISQHSQKKKKKPN